MKEKQLLLTAIAFAVCIIWGCKKELYDPISKPAIDKFSSKDLSAGLLKTDTSMIYTPFGPRRRSDVHLIEKGYQLNYSSDGHLQKIEKTTGKLITDFGSFDRLSVSNNSTSRNEIRNKFVPSSTDTGWDAYATVTQYKQPVQVTSTTWTVPSAPPSYANTQAIFIFNSLQSADSLTIIQPVLQYGAGPAGGGNYWSVQNYYIHAAVGSSPVFTGPVITVSPGTVLTGTITKSGSSGNYTYTSSFGSSYSSNDLTVTSSPYELLWGTQTLETYNTLNYNDLPADSAVKMVVSAGPSNTVTGWRLINAHTRFGMHVKQVGNNEIDLYFHNPPVPAITYATPDGYTVNTSISPLTPTNTGGLGAYSVSPALPSGLTINAATGVISGTPTVASSATNYTVTATNTTGSSNFTVNITVFPAPALSVYYGGYGGMVTFSVTPNIPSPVTGVLYWKDLNTGQTGSSANSPYGQTNSFTSGHSYQFYYIEYGTGSPSSATSNTVTFAVP